MKYFIVFLLIIFISGCSSDPEVDALANCLADKGVKEFGAFWCSHCEEQKRVFGPSDKIIKERGVYVECDARGKNGNPDLCEAEGVKGFPTWKFQDGNLVPGVLSLDQLARLSKCEYN
jgi:hypothetical protein